MSDPTPAGPVVEPEVRERLRELLAKASGTPWFFNSYSGVFSAPLSGPHEEFIDRLPEECNDRSCEACANLGGCKFGVEGYKSDPVVAWVPPQYGDTATGRHAEDARLIAAAVNALPALLDAAEQLPRMQAALREVREYIGPLPYQFELASALRVIDAALTPQQEPQAEGSQK